MFIYLLAKIIGKVIFEEETLQAVAPYDWYDSIFSEELNLIEDELSSVWDKLG